MDCRGFSGFAFERNEALELREEGHAEACCFDVVGVQESEEGDTKGPDIVFNVDFLLDRYLEQPVNRFTTDLGQLTPSTLVDDVFDCKLTGQSPPCQTASRSHPATSTPA